ncbi:MULTISPECIES: hypothetical protein [Pseudonocardia]|uniref:Integral membrane protein n=2 Tax=Pseudonocardia TaxID=1847 RepID=A0A1Y2MU55_PSEAH|nr:MULTISPECIES: hypothetical protein [Pseudonocardia]OSY38725.1 hypothetical protein BG845_03928 [Pseudonocardia autotrophica]TDN74927.1 hypothetical protein C8E95_4063 [Pseudonocardia autotrophica]BBF98866.1 hypothetical protein Pdca_00760 [Pseudonocardia autotrophica]GEC27854.1 hypothetical protein PSA01_48830 [Pseudonocardia saturnea]
MTTATVPPPRTVGRSLVVTAATAAVAEAVVGVLQLTRSDSGAGVHDARVHAVLTLFALALLAAAPLWWRLGVLTGARWAGGTLVAGNLLLAFGTTVSNVNGSDPAFFGPLAVVANAAVLVGLLGLAIAARRGRTLPGPLALLLPVYLIGLVPLSQLGGNLLRGAVLAAVLLALSTAAGRLSTAAGR